MKFYPDSINEILNKIVSSELPYDQTIVIGDNSSGKSLLLHLLVNSQKDRRAVYFIDAVNRVFDVTKITNDRNKPEYKTTIVNTRVLEEFFNLKDSFNCFGTLTERIEQIYSVYEDEVQGLFESLTHDRFQVIYGDALGEVKYEGGNGLLSSGYQAMIRLILELLYYQDMGIARQDLAEAWVVIDEIDEFLSPRYAAKILSFLREHFPQMRFIVTTHSIDLVVSAVDSNLVVLGANGYEVIDSNDYNSVSEVQMIFQKVFGKTEMQKTEVEEVLRRLLNNKINQAWSKEDEETLNQLQNSRLTAPQKLICRQIVEW